MGNNSWKAFPTSSAILTGLNYGTYRYVTDIGWGRAELLAAIEDSSVLHVHTHGAGSSFWTDVNDYRISYPSAPVLLAENAFAMSAPPGVQNFALFPTRFTAMGQDQLPPFNSTGNPPFNLVFLDACSAGTTNAFAEALLYPYGNWYVGTSQFPEDQALVGYSVEFEINQTQACNGAFWGALGQGYTVDEAREYAYYAYQGTNTPATSSEFMHVWGDFYTRLRGVYTGSQYPSPQINWFREI